MDPRFNTYPQRQAQPQVTQRPHQRFSWQAPVEEPTPSAQIPPTYQEVRRQPPPLVNTNIAPQHQRGFSYAPTPIEHASTRYTSNQPTAPSSPVFTPIDDRPQSMFNMLNTPAQRQSQQPFTSHARDDETTLSPSSPEAQTLPFMLVESVVGAEEQQAHIPSPTVSPTQTRHARQLSNLSPINTNLAHKAMPPIPQSPGSAATALPQKTPISPISSGPIRKDTPNSSYTPYTPHALHPPPTTPHAIFSPAAPSGPNGLDPSLHQPGQIRHPNMATSASKTWSTSLCSCTDIPTCLTGLFCPCILSGRTAHRLSAKSAGRDPTDMLAHSDANAHCVGMALACAVGLGWVVPTLQRVRVRHLYKLEGSCGGDLVRGCCCCWCVAVVNEREVKGREEGCKRWAGPAAGVGGYERGGGMEYVRQN